MTRQAPQQPPPPPITVTDGRKPNWYWIDDSINRYYAGQIKAAGIAVYTALVMASKGRHEFSADISTLAACAGLENRETATMAIQRLADAGLISIARVHGRANIYRILDVGARDSAADPQRRHAKTSPQPVGNSVNHAPHLTENPTGMTEFPTTPPDGKSDRHDGISDNQTPQPDGISDRFTPNLTENPTGMTDFPSLRRDPRRRIHTPTTESKNDDDTRARNALQPQPQTWDDLTALYGTETVIAAQRAAANQSKRNDLAYIRGVLRRRALQGAPPKRHDIFAPRPAGPGAADTGSDQLLPESSDAADLDPGQLPPSDLWSLVSDLRSPVSDLRSPVSDLQSPVSGPWEDAVTALSIGMTNGTAAMLASVAASVQDDTLVVTAPTDYVRGWLQNRLGDRILAAWRSAGGEDANQIIFAAAPAGRDRGQVEPS